MKQLLLIPIRIYRRFISRLKKAPCCRFKPSCSCYAYHAVSEWGFFIGFFLTVWRLLRCNPFCRGGYEPVPRRKRKVIPKTAILKNGGKKTQKAEKPPYMMLYEMYL